MCFGTNCKKIGEKKWTLFFHYGFSIPVREMDFSYLKMTQYWLCLLLELKVKRECEKSACLNSRSCGLCPLALLLKAEIRAGRHCHLGDDTHLVMPKSRKVLAFLPPTIVLSSVHGPRLTHRPAQKSSSVSHHNHAQAGSHPGPEQSISALHASSSAAPCRPPSFTRPPSSISTDAP